MVVLSPPPKALAQVLSARFLFLHEVLTLSQTCRRFRQLTILENAPSKPIWPHQKTTEIECRDFILLQQSEVPTAYAQLSTWLYPPVQAKFRITNSTSWWKPWLVSVAIATPIAAYLQCSQTVDLTSSSLVPFLVGGLYFIIWSKTRREKKKPFVDFLPPNDSKTSPWPTNPYGKSLVDIPTLDIIKCTEIKSLDSLKNLSSLKDLYIRHCLCLVTLDPLVSLTQLTDLRLISCPKLSCIEPLRHLNNLKLLHIIECPVKSIEPLSNLTTLGTLSLKQNDANSLQPLTTLENLTSLTIDYFPNLESVNPLLTLIRMRSLSLTRCPSIQSVTQLKTMHVLTSLTIAHCNNLMSTYPIPNMTSLITLRIIACDRLWLYSGLTDLLNLTTLELDCRQMKTIHLRSAQAVSDFQRTHPDVDDWDTEN